MDRPPTRTSAVDDSFDEYKYDDYIDSDYERFLRTIYFPFL